MSNTTKTVTMIAGALGTIIFGFLYVRQNSALNKAVKDTPTMSVADFKKSLSASK